MPQTTSWIYYRVFLNEPRNFTHFVTLLNQVISPMVEEFADYICHFHFFYYSGPYQEHLEGDEGVIKRLSGVGDEDHVAFIRLRIQADAEHASAIRESILSRLQDSEVVRGHEVPKTEFEPDRDLGARFGHTRTDAVLDLLYASSRLALSFAKAEEAVNPSPQGQGGPGGLVHLVANTLRYQIIPCVAIVSWGENLAYVQTGGPLL